MGHWGGALWRACAFLTADPLVTEVKPVELPLYETRRLVVAEPLSGEGGTDQEHYTNDSVSLVFATKPISDRVRFLHTAEHQFYVGIAVSHLAKSVTTEQTAASSGSGSKSTGEAREKVLSSDP
jgi:hypothetical protein